MRPSFFPLRSAAFRLAFAAMTTVCAAGSAKKTFNIPAGGAEAALHEFAKQAGGQIVFDVDKISGVRTAMVQGDYEPREALNRMFVHTGLVAVQDRETGALTIQRSPDPNGQRAAQTGGDRPENQSSQAL